MPGADEMPVHTMAAGLTAHADDRSATRPGDPLPPPGAERAAADPFGTAALSKLGHELRSPLGAIIGLSRVLLLQLEAGTSDAATQVRQISMIQTSAARSLSTIEQVVDLAKIASGGVLPRFQLADCRGIVTDMAASLRAAAAERGIRLRADLPDHPVMVCTDPGILSRILGELVGNGLKFSDAAEIRVRLQAGPPHAAEEPAAIYVCDDGPGIPAHEQARIFGPFERGELATSRDDGAAGLGLHLARQQARLLGAELSLNSQEGAGSTFAITFAHPRARPGTTTGVDPGS
jgi:signal transduction histidine kinase